MSKPVEANPLLPPPKGLQAAVENAIQKVEDAVKKAADHAKEEYHSKVSFNRCWSG